MKRIVKDILSGESFEAGFEVLLFIVILPFVIALIPVFLIGWLLRKL